METGEKIRRPYTIGTHRPVDQNQAGFSNLLFCKDALYGSSGKVPSLRDGR